MVFVRRFVLLLMILMLCPAALMAQDKKSNGNNNPKDVNSIFGGTPLLWRTDWVLDFYCGQITRYYNLNKEQEEYTRKLLGQRVKSFLQDHERDVRALMAEYMEYQTSQELPDARGAQDFARRAAPLARDIRKEIFEGNMRWREILDDAQRAKHDQDLKQMTMFFDNLDQGLDRWKRGQVQPTDLPGHLGQRPSTLDKIEDSWDFYVRTFIQNYKLDEGQQQTAHSILRELKEEAARYREANKDKFTELKAASVAIMNRPPETDPEKLAKYQEENAKLTRQRTDLERPITALFGQLCSRVDAIPTVDQRKAREAQRDRLKALTHVAGSRPATTQPAVVETQPATTNVAANANEAGS